MSLVLKALARKAESDVIARLDELRDERTVYVTEIVGCTMRPRLRATAPLLSIETSLAPPVVLGTLAHEGLARLASYVPAGSDCRVHTEYELEAVVEGVRVKGRVDLLVVCRDGCTVVELKTGRSAPDEAKRHHELQVQVYLDLLRLTEGLECRGEILYITHEGYAVFEVSPRPGVLEALVRDYLANSAAPRWSWECDYCPWRSICPRR